MGKLRHEFWMFCLLEASAAVATVVDFATTLLLAEVFGVWYAASTFLGALAGGVVNCTVNYRWVFGLKGEGKMRVAARFLMVWSGSIILNTVGTYILTELSGQYFLFAKIAVAICVAIAWNYTLQRHYVYSGRSELRPNE